MAVKEAVKQAIKFQLDIKALSDNDKIYHRGGDSLDVVEIVMEIEELLSIEISDDDIEKLGTMKVKDIVKLFSMA